ncbi:MAG: ABC transporter substrate-binding protein [Planctomycetes bacterium]|nr:ABC transporter substrate-binding protein [Planctomycetota bacterium]
MQDLKWAVHAAILLSLAAILACGSSSGPDGDAQDNGDQPAEQTGTETAPEQPADQKTETPKPIKWEIGKRGGQFVFSTISPPKSFNVIVSNESSSSTVLGFIYEGLTTTDPATTEVIPHLAESWDVSEDGLTYTFHLRKDVKWNDGAPFTAADVEFTFNELIYNDNIQNASRDIFTIAGEEIKVTAIDDHTARFILPKKFAPFLRAVGMDILPKHALKELVDKGEFEHSLGVDSKPEQIIGTGAFMLERYRSGQRVILKRNPHYWKRDDAGNQLPYLNRIIIEIVQNQDVAVMKFKQKELDYYALRGEDYPDLKPMEEAGDFKVFMTGINRGSQFLFFNQNNDKKLSRQVIQRECTTLGIKLEEPTRNDKELNEKLMEALPPDVLARLKDKEGVPNVDPVKLKWFRNVQFRKAVSHAIDRKSMVNVLMNGLGVPQWSPVGPGSPFFHNPNVPKHPFNPEKAAKILADAGFKDTNGDGFLEDPDGNTVEFNLTTNSENTVRIKMAEMIRKDLENIGFKVHFLPQQFNMLVSKLDSSFDWQAMILGLTGGIEPHFGQNVWKSSGHTHMWFPRQKKPSTEWEARINDLFDMGVQELDPEKRKEIYNEWQVIAADELPLIYTVLGKRIEALRSGLGNIHPTSYLGAIHSLERVYRK